MNQQLQILIALRDILYMIRDAEDPSQRKALGRIGLKMTNVTSLEETRADLETQLVPSILRECGRLQDRYGRIVAPVINGVCYACFVKIPSAVDTAENRDRSLRRCENCGMFLYWVEN